MFILWSCIRKTSRLETAYELLYEVQDYLENRGRKMGLNIEQASNFMKEASRDLIKTLEVYKYYNAQANQEKIKKKIENEFEKIFDSNGKLFFANLVSETIAVVEETQFGLTTGYRPYVVGQKIQNEIYRSFNDALIHAICLEKVGESSPVKWILNMLGGKEI